MTLREALIHQGNDPDVVDDIIAEMVSQVYDGRNPEDVLLDYDLEADYVFELLTI